MTPRTPGLVNWPQVYVAVFLLAIAAVALRMPERLSSGFIWAEDIVVFVKDAIEQGTPSSWRTYAGYHVLASRIFALFQSTFPIQWAPQMLAWENAAIIAACAAYLFGFWWRLSEQARFPCGRAARWGLRSRLLHCLCPISARFSSRLQICNGC